MTVSQLIEELNKFEDKEKEVIIDSEWVQNQPLENIKETPEHVILYDWI